MKVWEVWTEGVSDNGGIHPAHKHGMAASKTWDEAVLEVFEAKLTDQTVCGNPLYDAKGTSLYKDDKGHWRWYGCQVFDNEQDARRFCG